MRQNLVVRHISQTGSGRSRGQEEAKSGGMDPGLCIQADLATEHGVGVLPVVGDRRRDGRRRAVSPNQGRARAKQEFQRLEDTIRHAPAGVGRPVISPPSSVRTSTSVFPEIRIVEAWTISRRFAGVSRQNRRPMECFSGAQGQEGRAAQWTVPGPSGPHRWQRVPGGPYRASEPRMGEIGQSARDSRFVRVIGGRR